MVTFGLRTPCLQEVKYKGNIMTNFIVVLVTATSKVEAQKISKVLLKKRLAACANILPGITSFFHWKGKIQKANEVLLVIKTRKDLFKKLEKEVTINHSYSVPEVIALPILEGSKKYVDWLGSELSKK